jgi:hypothetical protein
MLQHFGRSEPVRIGSRNHRRFVRFEQQFIVCIEEAAGPRQDSSLDVITQDRVSCNLGGRQGNDAAGEGD